MSWSDAQRLRDLGHEVGCHTATHPVMARLGPEELHQEIAKAREALSRRLGAVDHFAFPFGRWSTISPAALEAASSEEFASCATAEAGCHVSAVSRSRPLLWRQTIDPDWAVASVRFVLAKAAMRGPENENIFCEVDSTG